MMWTQKLAEFVIDTKISDVPQEALDGVRDALIDTLGCALAGTQEEVCRIVVHFLRGQGGHRQATVWGVGVTTTASDAAFANGVLTHALDYDDTQSNLRGHPSAVLCRRSWPWVNIPMHPAGMCSAPMRSVWRSPASLAVLSATAITCTAGMRPPPRACFRRRRRGSSARAFGRATASCAGHRRLGGVGLGA